MREELKNKITEILEEMGVKNPKVILGFPTHIGMGDYSTNVAMIYAKEINNKIYEKKGDKIIWGNIPVKKPVELAEDIKRELEVRKIKHIDRIEVASPGFINFFFTPEFFADAVLAKPAFAKGSGEARPAYAKGFGEVKPSSAGSSGEAMKVIVEYTDPNPFKEFHIGHLMSNAVGESISRIVEAQGVEVKRACYQGDVGLHVAMAVWGMMQLKYNLGKITAEELGKAYAYGSTRSQENEDIKKEIIEINKKIFSREDSNINEFYDIGKVISLEYFETIYKKLGTKFDFYFFESETGKFGKLTVEENIGDIFERSEGAIIFRGENHDPKLHTRVFLNKEELPTYEAKELGLSKIKYDKYPHDLSIVVTGNEVDEYFKVLLKVISLVFPELAEKTKHISHGMLRLPTGKMSSRTGDVITAKSLIDTVKEKILEKMADSPSREASAERRREMSDDKKQEVAEIIAIGALKFSILKQAIGKDIIFDFEKSVSFEGDSGPYLQYATVRANSILKKANMSRTRLDIPAGWQTTNLERYLERFPDIVKKAGAEYAPSHIVTYLIELAGEFNSFYSVHKIIDETDPSSPYKLAITRAFADIMTAGLDLLGIKVPSEM